jgi:hypothetical protein
MPGELPEADVYRLNAAEASAPTVIPSEIANAMTGTTTTTE